LNDCFILLKALNSFLRCKELKMKKCGNILGIVSISIIVSLNGCGIGNVKTCQYVPFPDQSKEIENPDMVRIYIGRPTSLEHDRPIKIMDGDTYIGDIGPYGYLCWEREPGQATITLINDKGDRFIEELRTEKGKVYYFQQYLWPIANTRIRIRTKTESLEYMGECSPPETNE
jgi:hypothetical protein